jgi:hypothetical protein
MMSPDDDDIRVAGCRRIQTTLSLSLLANQISVILHIVTSRALLSTFVTIIKYDE